MAASGTGFLERGRAIGLVIAVGCAAAAQYTYHALGRQTDAWWLLGAALLLAAIAQYRLDPGAEEEPATPLRPRRTGRVALGWVVALCGAGLWAWGVRSLYLDWAKSLDQAWLAWLGAAIALSVGFDLAWGRRGQTTRRTSRAELLALIAAVTLAAIYRLGNVTDFPGEGAVTQVEELQYGDWGHQYLNGGRLRWEYLSFQWLAALGIWLGGPSLAAVRVPLAVVSTLKLVPFFLWLRFSVGSVGAVVGTFLLACSLWDVIHSRIAGNHNVFVVAAAFALLAGPARRGRPSAYVILGLLGGYFIFEYVAYRPLILLIPVGAVMLSFRDRSVGWLTRLGRPLITVALIATMAVPLFLKRIDGRVWHEYFNGWNRAHADASYYNPDASWRAALDRKVARSFQAAGLFLFDDDPSPVRGAGSPLLDPVTGALLIVGMGYAAAHLVQPVFGLTLIAFVATVVGTLVVTANFDTVRVGSAVGYAYALVGYGAAGVARALIRAWPRAGPIAGAVMFAGAGVTAVYLNTTALLGYWASPTVHRALRSNLSYLTAWLSKNARDGEQVVGVAPAYSHVLRPNDSFWLLGRPLSGIVTDDIEAALHYWAQNPRSTLFFAFAGQNTRAVQQYLRWLAPDFVTSFVPDPLSAGGEIAYAHTSGFPTGLGEPFSALQCTGARVKYQLMSWAQGSPVKEFSRVVPFVDGATWPGEVRSAAFILQPQLKEIRMRIDAAFHVAEDGDYRFDIEVYAGRAELRVDGSSDSRLFLARGDHVLEAEGVFLPASNEPTARLYWTGPATGGARQLMPLYRLATGSPACLEERHRVR